MKRSSSRGAIGRLRLGGPDREIGRRLRGRWEWGGGPEVYFYAFGKQQMDLTDGFGWGRRRDSEKSERRFDGGGQGVML